MTAGQTKGRVLRGNMARWYDLLAWILLLGREDRFRRRIVGIAGLRPGDSVLDVGCGTGTLAIAAKQAVGPRGRVVGIDASPDMIERANDKAARRDADVEFRVGTVEALPFRDEEFSAVLSTLMFHHLPRALRQQCAAEIRRVLEPGGKLTLVDFARSSGGHRGLIAHFHRHGSLDAGDVRDTLEGAGLRVATSGPLGVRDLFVITAVAP